MKCVHLLLLFFIVVAGEAGAQFSLTSANVPTIGDVITVYGLDDAAEGSAGDNVTWDFSKSLNTGMMGRWYFMPPTGSTYASYFPTATVLFTDSSSNWSYYNFNSAYSILGYADGDGGITQYSPGKLLYNYPLNYNSLQVHSFSGTNNARGKLSGSDSSSIDGYGTLILPDGTTRTNVIRQKIVETIIDSTYISGTNSYDVTRRRIFNYNYFQQNSAYSLIHVRYDSVYALNGTTYAFLESSRKVEVVWNVLSNATTTAALASTIISTVTISPNPSRANVQINFGNIPVTNLILTDIVGGAVMSKQEGNIIINGNTAFMNVSLLPEGRYLLEIYTSTTMAVKELVVGDMITNK